MAIAPDKTDKIFRTENPTAEIDLCFCNHLRGHFSSNVTHHTQSSFTTRKYYFLFPPKGQRVVSNVRFLQFEKTAILNPRNSSCGAISISSHLKPSFSGRLNKTGGHNHKFLLMLKFSVLCHVCRLKSIFLVHSFQAEEQNLLFLQPRSQSQEKSC